MMVFNLENMFEKFSLQFDDRIFAKRGENCRCDSDQCVALQWKSAQGTDIDRIYGEI